MTDKQDETSPSAGAKRAAMRMARLAELIDAQPGPHALLDILPLMRQVDAEFPLREAQ